MIAKTPFLGSAYTSRSRLLNAQRCVNLYPELVETKDGKEVGAFYGCPGTLPVAQGPTGPWRGLHSLGNGTSVGVLGGTFYQITGAWRLTALGNVTTNSGPVGMVDNGTQVLVVDGDHAYGYSFTTGTFAQIVLPFEGGFPVVCAYQDGFFLINQTGTQKWWQSNLNDVFTWNALNFSSKDGQPDPIVTMLDNHREVWLFGSQTTEVWINVGNAGFAFQRLQGVFIQEGCCCPYSAQVVGDAVIWLSRNKEGVGMVMRAQDYVSRKISTHAIDREIASYPKIDDAFAYTYQQEGHLFYVLIFPSGDATWCYDTSTGLWHERAGFSDGLFHRHRSNCCAVINGRVVVGDYANGKLHALDLDTYTDDSQIRKWLRSWQAQPTGQITLRNNRFNSLQLYMDPGVGGPCGPNIRVLQSSDDDWRVLQSSDDDVRVLSGEFDEDCENPKVMLRWSDSGGLSWSNEHWEPVGKIGEVQHRVIWSPLGSSRDRVWEVSATDPFKPALIGAIMDMEAGIN